MSQGVHSSTRSVTRYHSTSGKGDFSEVTSFPIGSRKMHSCTIITDLFMVGTS